ncbi:MAG: PAS domain S-box protein, partial [Deltaproteobacteria bacterium]|nr:PAS domain S-box protein [Deltaproteobacteria bacterium]
MAVFSPAIYARYKRRALKLVQHGVFCVAADGSVSAVNGCFRQMLGLDEDDTRSAPVRGVFAKDEHVAKLLGWLGQDQGSSHEMQFSNKQGRTFLLSCRARRLSDHQGHFREAVCIVDAGPEPALFDERDDQLGSRYRAVLAQAGIAAMLCDVQGQVTAVNATCAELLGQGADALIGSDLFDHVAASGTYVDQSGEKVRVPGIRDEQKYAAVREVFARGWVVIDELYVLRTDDRVVSVAVTASLLEGRPDGNASVLVVVRDLSGEKQSRRQFEMFRQQLAQSEELKKEILANISHELRTPLNGIIGVTELLCDTELSAEQNEFLMLMRQSSNNLMCLVNNMLDFAKLQSGRVELNAADFTIAALLDGVLHSYVDICKSKGIVLTAEIAPDVPACVHSDVKRLRQILNILVENAVKFTEKGSVAVECSCVLDTIKTSQRHNGCDTTVQLLFTIQDTGIGIVEEKRENVFDCFTQADGSFTRKYGGTGLGLSIARELVGLMGGEIWFECPAPAVAGAELGEGGRPCGTTFYFNVCCGVSEQEPTQAGPAVPRGEPAAATVADLSPQSGEASRILVAEDDYVNQQVISEILQKFGYYAEIVVNGHEAVAKLEQHDFDLV